MYRLGALLLLTWSFAAMAQEQPAMLTLACNGTTTDSSQPDANQPISMGIIVNFADRTVQGFGSPGLIEYPVVITAANDVAIVFGGHQEVLSSLSSIQGSIDRVTGDVQARSTTFDPKTSHILTQSTYALQCRPTQRMF
jgi:hypothetical protein